MKIIERTQDSWLYCYNEHSCPASSSTSSSAQSTNSGYKLHVGLPVDLFDKYHERVHQILKKAVEDGVIPQFKRLNIGDTEQLQKISGADASIDIHPRSRLMNNPFTIYLFADFDSGQIAALCQQIENLLKDVPATKREQLSEADLDVSAHISFRQESLNGEYVKIAGAAPEDLQTLQQQAAKSSEYQALYKACNQRADTSNNTARGKENHLRGFYNANYQYFYAELTSGVLKRQYQAALGLLNIDTKQFSSETDVQKKQGMITKPYHDASKKYHPDRFSTAKYSDTQSKATAVFNLYNAASSLLKKLIEEPSILDETTLLAQEGYRPTWQYELTQTDPVALADPYFYTRMAKSSATYLVAKNWSFDYVPETLSTSDTGTAIQIFKPVLQVAGQNQSTVIAMKGHEAFFHLCMAGALPRRFKAWHFGCIFSDEDFSSGQKWLLEKALTTPELIGYFSQHDLVKLATRATKDGLVQAGNDVNEVFEYIYRHFPETCYGAQLKAFKQYAGFDADRAARFVLANPANLGKLERDALWEVAKISPDIMAYVLSSQVISRHLGYFLDYQLVWPLLQKTETNTREFSDIKAPMNVALVQTMYGNYTLLPWFSDSALSEFKSFVANNSMQLPIWINDSIDEELEQRKDREQFPVVYGKIESFREHSSYPVEAELYILKTFFSGDPALIPLLNKDALVWLAAQPDVHWSSLLPIAGALMDMGEHRIAETYLLQIAREMNVATDACDAELLYARLQNSKTEIDQIHAQWKHQTKAALWQQYKQAFLGDEDIDAPDMLRKLDIHGISSSKRYKAQQAAIETLKPEYYALLDRLGQGEMSEALRQDFKVLRQKVVRTATLADSWQGIEERTWKDFSEKDKNGEFILGNQCFTRMYMLIGLQDRNEIWWRNDSQGESLDNLYGLVTGGDLLDNLERLFFVYDCLGKPEEFYNGLQSCAKSGQKAFAGLTTFDREAVCNYLTQVADNELAVFIEGRRERVRYISNRFYNDQNIKSFPELHGLYVGLGQEQHLEHILPPSHKYLLGSVSAQGAGNSRAMLSAASVTHDASAIEQRTGGVHRYLTHYYNKDRRHHIVLMYGIVANASMLTADERQRVLGRRGDRLKREILDIFAERINACERGDLDALIATIRGSAEYNLLKVRQNPWLAGRFFKPQTDSITQLESLINRTQDALHIARTFP